MYHLFYSLFFMLSLILRSSFAIDSNLLVDDEVVTLYPIEHPGHARMGAIVEFDEKTSKFEILGR